MSNIKEEEIDWQTMSYQMKPEHIEKLEDMKYWERYPAVKHLLAEILDKFFKGKDIKPRPDYARRRKIARKRKGEKE